MGFEELNLLANMYPEDLLIDNVIEALKEYKILRNSEPPKAPFTMLMIKWENKGLSNDEIIKKVRETVNIHKVGSQITKMNEN